MNGVSDIKLYEMKKVFERVCMNIGIPKDAVYFKQNADDEYGRFGIYCKDEYFDAFADYMYSLDGWEPIKDADVISINRKEQNDNTRTN